ncbi:helix-turn-helix transcriptional regulator [Occultella glacieicola]|uniref:helix-turn-helix transcriptional regulator n=1 Tax=Occultella glacieicola TaxID=2518684 RepID=UPI001404DABF|nr:LuxR C-terminal-related transcriptional regulator [Occultella glacieicola]
MATEALGRHALFELAGSERVPDEDQVDPAWAATTPVAKVEVPDVGAHVLARHALLDRLSEDVAEHGLTLVSAPAGYGKSTLLTTWCAQGERTVAWLTVDEFDNDPRRLFRGLVNALQAAVRRDGRRDATRLLALVPRYRVDPEQYDALLTALEDLRAPIVLIVDDLHEVDDVASREVIGRLLKFAPPSLRLILSGRSDPNLPVHRRRLDGTLGELREADLAFGRADVVAVATRSGLELEESDADLLLDSTGGWPVAVRMAIVALGSSRDLRSRLLAMRGADLPLTGYLTDEILGTLRPELATFILHATIGDRIRGDLAAVLHPDGAALLEECVRLGVFLTVVGGGAQEFRWHALFAAQCRAILERGDPQTALALRRRAARYWASADLPLAVSLAVSGQDGRYALALVRTHWPDLLLRGESEVLRRLCAQLSVPEADDPEVLFVLALCEFLDDRSVGRATRARARVRAASLPADRSRRVEIVDALLELFVATDDAELVAAAARVRALLPGCAPEDRAVEAFGFFLVGEAAVRLQEDAAVALGDLRRAETLASGAALPELEAASAALACVPTFALGRFEESATLARTAVDGGRRAGRSGSSSLVPAHLVLGVTEHWRDRPGPAREHLEEAVRRSQPRQSRLREDAALHLMLVALATDDAALAASARRAVRADGEPGARIAAVRIEAIMDGLREDAHADPRAALARVAGIVPTDPVVRVWVANLHRRAGAPTEARAVLAGIPAEPRGDHVEIGVGLTSALLAAAEGATEDAHLLLEGVLGTAEGLGITRPFLDHASEISPLLSAHLAWGTQHGTFVVDLVTQIRDRVPIHRSSSFWELTDRELTVLTYLRSPMTAAEIGRSLFVSANTVKTHMRAVYRKLGASGRREAVRIAVERELL